MSVYLKDFTPLNCDNKSLIHIAHNSVFAHHHLNVGTMSLQIGDILNKLHPVLRFRFLFNKLSTHLSVAL